MRTDPLFAAPPVPELKLSSHFEARGKEKGTYAKYAPVKRVACEECVWTLHEARGVGEPPRGARVKCTSGGVSTVLCTGHAELWKKREGR